MRSGTEREDARQIANLALIEAVDRFDPSLGTRFSTYAARTILGRLKRERRDRSWDLNVPRSLQERWLLVARARDELAQELGAEPTAKDIADRLGYDQEDVLAAMEAGRAHSVSSLDRPAYVDDAAGGSVGSRVGRRDARLDRAPLRAAVSEVMEHLDERDRRILYLRFFEGKTQEEIGTEVGVSQMQISRLLRSSIDELRQRLA